MPALQNEGLHKSQYVAYLSCKHEIRFSVGEPTPGDSVFCTRCYEYQRVLHCALRFGVNCLNCRYAKSHGGEIAALTFAEKHARKYRGHTVDIWGPDAFHRQVTTQPTLFDVVECPF